MCAVAFVLIAVIAWGDWELPDTSIGFLYLIPILLSAAALNKKQIFALAALCGYFREAFDPLQMAASSMGHQLRVEFNPSLWVPGSMGRMLVAIVGFAMTGFFVSEVNHRRRLLSEHLNDRERQISLRLEAERQLRILIETSPLAILTLDSTGHVVLANESARQLLGFEEEPLQGVAVEAYLPILRRMLQSHHAGGSNIRTNVECKGQRRDGEVFLAHVWLSTYRTSERRAGRRDLGCLREPARPGRRGPGFHDGDLGAC